MSTMSSRQRQSFVGGLLAAIAFATIAFAAVAIAGRINSPQPLENPTGLEEVDINALAPLRAASASASPTASSAPSSAGVSTLGEGLADGKYPLPAHGALMYDLNSILPTSPARLNATLGNAQLDKVQMVDRAIRFEVSATSRAVLPFPSTMTAGNFVAVLNLDLMSGQGAFTFVFHMNQEGEQQHAVQVYTDGTVEAVLFPGNAGARSLFNPSTRVGNLSGNTQLTVAVNGPNMTIYVDGVQVGTALDGTLTQGGMEIKAGGADRGPPLVLRLTDMEIYAAPSK